VVWGGIGIEALAALNTGGRYDPVADSWTPTSTGAAPEDALIGDAPHPGGETMTLALYQRVVLTQEDLPKEGLRAGDVGVIVEHYLARASVPEGYKIEVFAANGQTVAVVSVPAAAVREAAEHEILSVREMARA
jgi:Domain of unknown function (DUF4926)